MRTFYFILLFIVSFEVWSTDSTLNLSEVYTFKTQEVESRNISVVQVKPTEQILNIFKDNDANNLYFLAEEYLKLGGNYAEIDIKISNYINSLLVNNTDGILTLIDDELLKSLKQNNYDESFMILGSNKIVCTNNFKQ